MNNSSHSAELSAKQGERTDDFSSIESPFLYYVSPHYKMITGLSTGTVSDRHVV